MASGFEVLSAMEYPGRLIIIGRSPAGDDVVCYAVTGRSPSSQSRRIVKEKRNLYVQPVDEKVLQSGNPDLLVYPALMVGRGKAIAVSNGKQTEDIAAQFKKGASPIAVLAHALSKWEYEPDAPNYTPRISGCVTSCAAISIIKRGIDGSVQRAYYEVPTQNGIGRLIATYAGPNADTLPSFTGNPIDIQIPYATAREACTALYKALGPASGKNDLRVAAAAVYRSSDGKIKFAVKNRNK